MLITHVTTYTTPFRKLMRYLFGVTCVVLDCPTFEFGNLSVEKVDLRLEVVVTCFLRRVYRYP